MDVGSLGVIESLKYVSLCSLVSLTTKFVGGPRDRRRGFIPLHQNPGYGPGRCFCFKRLNNVHHYDKWRSPIALSTAFCLHERNRSSDGHLIDAVDLAMPGSCSLTKTIYCGETSRNECNYVTSTSRVRVPCQLHFNAYIKSRINSSVRVICSLASK